MSIVERIKKVGVLPMLYKLKHLYLKPSDDVVSICSREGAYEYLLRYQYALKNENNQGIKHRSACKVIWTCWLQGLDNAPDVVKKCIASMHQYANDYEVIVIDAKNVSEYVQLPDYIKEKYSKGIIPHAHYSDLIRLELLRKFGGVWIDSTILLTDRLPQYILDADLFVFRGYTMGKVCIYNPLLAAKPNNPLIISMLNLLMEYWKKENKLVSYSIFHLFFTMAIERSSINRELWEKVPFSYGSQMFYLQSRLGKPYNEEAYRLAVRLSSIHKLTYKKELCGGNPFQKGTFYDVVINEGKFK